MVRGSARHLLDLINDVLDISKIEAGEMKIHCNAIDLRALVERVIASLAPGAARKGLRLLATLPVSLAPLVSDLRRVEQVLLNLVNNAIKFTEHGDVSVTVAVSAGDAPRVRIQIADTGVGISPDHLILLFQPFRQIDAGLTRHREGTGLGLAICRRLCHLLGGTVEVASEPNVGSVFTVTLPMTPDGQQP
jgi:signal transduction histidine kinase